MKRMFKRLPTFALPTAQKYNRHHLARTARTFQARYINHQQYAVTNSLLRKLDQGTLTKSEVKDIIEQKWVAESDLENFRQQAMRQQQSGAGNMEVGSKTADSPFVPASPSAPGGDKGNPLYVERVGEKRLASLVGSVIFWCILLGVYIHFQRRSAGAGLGGILDDNYSEYDEISWEDDDDEKEELVEEPQEDEYERRRRIWLEKLGLPVSIDAAGSNQTETPTRKKQKRVTFAEVCGCEEAKTDLEDLVHYLKHPEKFKEMGVKLPKGVLLEGPPGTGKTLMARALAGEAKVPFLSTNGSSFDQVFVGIGVMRVKNLFNRAKQLAPCIVFIDEIDAVGSTRNTVSTSPHASDSLNALLVEMDGFEDNNGVIVVAATNMAERLDSALVRAGRFDRTIRVPLPDKATRGKIVDLYLKHRGDDTVNVDDLVSDMAGFSGADLSNLVNLAGIEAVKNDLKKITMKHLVEAKETIAMGRARTSMVIPVEEKKLTAFHEGGHAIVALYTKGANPIYKATLLPRGGALGMVTFTNKDEYSKTKEALIAQLDVAMGGRAAEELVFGRDNVTTGASSDFNQATQTARRMVCQYGMSAKVGKVYYELRDIPKLSPDIQNLINEEVKRLLDESFSRSINLLKKHRNQLDKLAENLLEKETMNVGEIKELLGWEVDQVKKPQDPLPVPLAADVPRPEGGQHQENPVGRRSQQPPIKVPGLFPESHTSPLPTI